MPSVYEVRHVELDNIGRGKRQVRTPVHAESSDIFGNRNSPNGSIASTPSSPSSSSPSSRRGSFRGEDTKGRLFGLNGDDSQVRKVRDTLKSSGIGSIFSDVVVDSPRPSPKKTGNSNDGSSNRILSLPSDGLMASAPSPVPVVNPNVFGRVRQPPGGKPQGIF